MTQASCTHGIGLSHTCSFYIWYRPLLHMTQASFTCDIGLLYSWLRLCDGYWATPQGLLDYFEVSFTSDIGLFYTWHRSLLHMTWVSFTRDIGLFNTWHRSLLHMFARLVWSISQCLPRILIQSDLCIVYRSLLRMAAAGNGHVGTEHEVSSDFALCAGACCCVLQCVAVRCSALQCVAVRCSALQCVAVCCSALQCVAVCCRHMT